MSDDKPAPGIRVHVAAGAELDRLAETLDVRPREGASEWRPHPETDVDLRGRILARLGAMPPRGPSPQHGFVDPLDIPCPTHKVPAGQVCGFLDGDGAACCWRIIAAGPPMPESAIEYDNQCRPINVRHVSLNADGSFTMAYEEGAMDPVKPAACASLDMESTSTTARCLNPAITIPDKRGHRFCQAHAYKFNWAYVDPSDPGYSSDIVSVVIPAKPAAHPAPWRWFPSTEKPGTWLALQDARGANLVNGWMETASPDVRAIIAAAPEMEALLRRATDLVNQLTPFALGFAAEYPGSKLPTKIEIDDVYRELLLLLARIDAAKAGT